jgi:hypothetical protein
VSTTARALATVTGHPGLKLLMLTVAAIPGWPTAADVAAAAELDPATTDAGLAELVARRQLVRSTGEMGVRYGLPDDGWGHTRDDSADGVIAAVDAAVDPVVAAALRDPDVGRYPMGGRVGETTGEVRA